MKKFLFAAVCLLFAGAAVAQSPAFTKCATPAYDNVENVLDAIIAEYPDQVVFVDFWATWCPPCLRAMETIKPLKPWMEENKVAKVYISLDSSNREQWEKMIAQIGGNHYFLTKEETVAVSKRYGMTGVPSYQVYNKAGEMTFKHTGYPGNEKMQAEFEKAAENND